MDTTKRFEFHNDRVWYLAEVHLYSKSSFDPEPETYHVNCSTTGTITVADAKEVAKTLDKAIAYAEKMNKKIKK